MSEIEEIARKAKFSARSLFGGNADSTNSSIPVEQLVRANKTKEVMNRLRGNPFFEEATPENRNGMWQGRRIIGRDTPINKGVYLGGKAREAIVIDDEKQPVLDGLYRNMVNRIVESGCDFKGNALVEVYNLVGRVIHFDIKEVDKIFEEAGGIPDQKIGLDNYIARGVGVCRHQALLCGYLIERLVADHYIFGKVSVDRNFIVGLGGHAWTRYVESNGNVIILDVAKGYIGLLDDMQDKHYSWFYRRPEDVKRKR